MYLLNKESDVGAAAGREEERDGKPAKVQLSDADIGTLSQLKESKDRVFPWILFISRLLHNCSVTACDCSLQWAVFQGYQAAALQAGEMTHCSAE